MPCTGPDHGAAMRHAGQIFDEVMQHLKEKHHISEFPLPEGRTGRVFGCSSPRWYAARDALKKALEDLVWADYCDSF